MAEKKFLLSAFIDTHPVGERFPSDEWPLHITIVPTFMTDWNTESLEDDIQKTISTRRAFSVRVGSPALFGEAEDIPVRVISDSDELRSLHTDMLSVLKRRGTSFKNEEHTGGSYRPHITDQKDTAASEGQEVVVKDISLVDREPSGDDRQCEVVRNYSLRES